jgi:hypothetical protein
MKKNVSGPSTDRNGPRIFIATSACVGNRLRAEHLEERGTGFRAWCYLTAAALARAPISWRNPRRSVISHPRVIWPFSTWKIPNPSFEIGLPVGGKIQPVLEILRCDRRLPRARNQTS